MDEPQKLLVVGTGSHTDLSYIAGDVHDHLKRLRDGREIGVFFHTKEEIQKLIDKDEKARESVEKSGLPLDEITLISSVHRNPDQNRIWIAMFDRLISNGHKIVSVVGGGKSLQKPAIDASESTHVPVI